MKYYFFLFFLISSTSIFAMDRGYVDGVGKKKYPTYNDAEYLVLFLELDEELFPDYQMSPLYQMAKGNGWENFYLFFRHYLVIQDRYASLKHPYSTFPNKMDKVIMRDAINRVIKCQNLERDLFKKSNDTFVISLILAKKHSNMHDFFLACDGLSMTSSFAVLLKTNICLDELYGKYDDIIAGRKNAVQEKLLDSISSEKIDDISENLVIKPGGKKKRKGLGKFLFWLG